MTAVQLIRRIHHAWHRHVTYRRRWQFVHCRAFTSGYCCYAAFGDGDSEFIGCQADVHNEWVAARFWRRWVAEARDAVAMLRKGRAA